MAYQSITPAKFAVQAVTAVEATAYTVPASSKALLKDISICNTTAAPITLNIYLVPSGGSAGTSNALFYGVSFAANSTTQWNGLQVLDTGDFIRTSASAAGLTVHFSGGVAV